VEAGDSVLLGSSVACARELGFHASSASGVSAAKPESKTEDGWSNIFDWWLQGKPNPPLFIIFLQNYLDPHPTIVEALPS